MHVLRQVFLLALVTFSKTRAASQGNESGEVVFVNVLHRHGDRTPASFYPTDPYQNTSYWPEGLGQLTNAGKRRVFELGQWLSRRYESLLTKGYSSDTVYIQSTDKDRTLMSAQCNLAGMFPPKGIQVWNNDLAWQPVPVHTTPQRLDKVLAQPPKVPCPAYEKELQIVFTSDEKIRQLNQTYSELLRWTSENSGAESLNNLTLPEWTKSVFPEPMREANVYNYRLVSWTPQLARLSTGLLLQEMIQSMVDKVKNKTTRNVHIYSAHDETITNLLIAVGAFKNILPPYASCLMMELRIDSSGNYHVSLYYRNSTSDGPYLLTVAGCDPVCPLDTFISISQSLIPEDWDKECSATDDDQNSYLSIVLSVVAVVIVVILIMLALYYCYHRRKSL